MRKTKHGQYRAQGLIKMASLSNEDFEITFRPTRREFSGEPWIFYDLIVESIYPSLNIKLRNNSKLTITLDEIKRFAQKAIIFLEKKGDIQDSSYFLKEQGLLKLNFVPLELQFELNLWDEGLGEDEEFPDEEPMVGVEFWINGDVIPDFEFSSFASIGIRFLVPADELSSFIEDLVSEFAECYNSAAPPTSTVALVANS